MPAMRVLIREALRQVGLQEGKDWRYLRLPPQHPLFHCYYDHGYFWAGGAGPGVAGDSSPTSALGPEVLPCRLGVNVLVYALTREGSLAQRLVSAE